MNSMDFDSQFTTLQTRTNNSIQLLTKPNISLTAHHQKKSDLSLVAQQQMGLLITDGVGINLQTVWRCISGNSLAIP